MRIRNPHATNEWTGDWGDSSPLWEAMPDVAAAVGHVRADDGIFFMAFDDFIARFSHIEHVDPPFGGVVLCALFLT